MSLIADFVKSVQEKYKTGAATEHSYRPALECLFNSIAEEIHAINEPKRIACGAPDFIIQHGEIAVGYVEAKDIGVSIRGMKDTNKKQQERYKQALPNLIYTNCLDWDFYRNGELIASVTVAHFLMGIQPRPEKYKELENLLRDFIAQRPQTITSPKVLAEIMAAKANLIKDVLHNALESDKELETEISAQYHAFRMHLIRDISTSEFADVYAETIAYGMFAARLHDTTLDTFSRHEALELLPKSNPFLRSLFSYIAGHDLDERIAWVIDDLAMVFQAANVAKIMEGFGRLTAQKDPFLHFYETFLAAYNPAKRKARGVWYTPEPVVNFIVRAVDEVLQNEFGLTDGLADTSKITIDWDTGHLDKKGRPISLPKSVHRVQILDPATGTGTFLAQAIKHIAPKIKGVAPGMWSNYIEKDLIPRLHGFELLMASYAMCHMKLDMILAELGYKPTGTPPRLSVYLTNSLEEGEPANLTLPFAQWLSNESKQANVIKRDMPIMCVLGNPPYLGESKNKGKWIMDLMEVYKKEPGGKQKLQERNSKWINDDYVKFIRMSEHLIEKNGEGVLGFVTNHGYLDNPTFRGMRWHLLNTFDKLYVLDLHGNSKKKEIAPNGKSDKNIFDIQQGVSIVIGIKSRVDNKDLAEVYYGELWGSKEEKHFALNNGSVSTLMSRRVKCIAPQYGFVPRSGKLTDRYERYFSVKEFMPLHGNGIVTKRDRLNVHHSADAVVQVARDFLSLTEGELRNKYKLPEDVRDWRYEWARQDVLDNFSKKPIHKIGYRLFDDRYVFYSGRSRGLIGWPVPQVMQQYLRGENFGLLTSKAHRDSVFAHVFITNKPTDAIHFSATTGSNAMNFPLYIYPSDEDLNNVRLINFDDNLFSHMKGLAKHEVHGLPDEVDVFDYIYAVLHCNSYRILFSEFLKNDFPRIPWPVNADEFWDVSSKGSLLRKLHLMESSAIGATPFPFTGEGDNVVTDARFNDGKVWINDAQYFDNVPEVSWGFYIGGYQPALKWLKDRKGRLLSFDDVKHYQKIIKILAETDRIMNTITMKLDVSVQ